LRLKPVKAVIGTETLADLLQMNLIENLKAFAPGRLLTRSRS